MCLRPDVFYTNTFCRNSLSDCLVWSGLAVKGSIDSEFARSTRTASCEISRFVLDKVNYCNRLESEIIMEFML